MAGRGGAVLQREGPVCIDLRIYFIREGFQFVHTVWVLFFFIYGFGFCFFLFVVGRVVVCSGTAGRDRCMKKSAGDVCLRRLKGRLPTLPLAQYHRRDQV